jgi:hypothetical protein
MKKRYEWRVLTDDGLLKKPALLGPYYEQFNVNGYDGFESEDLAIAAYDRFKASHGYSVELEMVLVCFYSPEDANTV